MKQLLQNLRTGEIKLAEVPAPLRRTQSRLNFTEIFAD